MDFSTQTVLGSTLFVTAPKWLNIYCTQMTDWRGLKKEIVVG